MPLVDVTYSAHVAADPRRGLARMLPQAVSVAAECPEEPYDGVLQPGDVEIRFRQRSPYDPDGLDLVIEVRSTWFPSREETRQQRCEGLCAAVGDVVGDHSVGVYPSLPVAGWAQSEI